AVEVVAEHEAARQLAALADPRAVLLADGVAGGAAAGERLLVPAAVAALRVAQVIGRAPRRRRLGAIRGDEREQRPRGLRRRARAAAARARTDVRLAALAEAAVAVLALDEPAHGAPHREAVHRLADRGERRQHRADAVDVVHAPSPEPRALGLLLRVQVAEP